MRVVAIDSDWERKIHNTKQVEQEWLPFRRKDDPCSEASQWHPVPLSRPLSRDFGSLPSDDEDSSSSSETCPLLLDFDSDEDDSSDEVFQTPPETMEVFQNQNNNHHACTRRTLTTNQGYNGGSLGLVDNAHHWSTGTEVIFSDWHDSPWSTPLKSGLTAAHLQNLFNVSPVDEKFPLTLQELPRSNDAFLTLSDHRTSKSSSRSDACPEKAKEKQLCELEDRRLFSELVPVSFDTTKTVGGDYRPYTCKESYPIKKASTQLKNSEVLKEKVVLGSDTDFNMVSRTLNKFTLSSSKQRDILKLVQARLKQGTDSTTANIFEGPAGSHTRNYLTEPKILNTRWTAWRHRRTSYSDIADGLVLEKVKHDPNWKRNSGIFRSSGQALKEFRQPLTNSHHLRDSRVSTSVPAEDSQRTFLMDKPLVRDESRDCGNSTLVDQSVSSQVSRNLGNKDKVLDKTSEITNSSEESPVENTTPVTSQSKDMESGLKEGEENSRPTTKKSSLDFLGDFDVYNIETTMPTIDWEAMEAHLKMAAREEDWLTRRRQDREEIRRRLAQDSDSDDYFGGQEKTGRKPSLTTRLQSGMNLQLCFMNESPNDHYLANDNDQRPESPTRDDQPLMASTAIDQETSGDRSPNNNSQPSPTDVDSRRQRPSFFFAKQKSWRLRPRQKHEIAASGQEKEIDNFYSRQAKLQAEARLALAQAKDMAKMQMEVERQKSKKSPIADIVGWQTSKNSSEQLSRHLLLDMNIAQLQVIVNDLHSQIEGLNEELVRHLLKRDDLHMEQDSMLVDIEDLSRYLGGKDEGHKSMLELNSNLCSK